jgi:hypothetical protein
MPGRRENSGAGLACAVLPVLEPGTELRVQVSHSWLPEARERCRVEPRGETQLDMQSLHRAQSRLVDRAALVNQLRALPFEPAAAPRGRRKLEVYLEALLTEERIPLGLRMLIADQRAEWRRAMRWLTDEAGPPTRGRQSAKCASHVTSDGVSSYYPTMQTDLSSNHEATIISPTGPHGGPTYIYRGVLIESNEDGTRYSFHLGGFPGNGKDGVSNLQLILWVIDAWFDHGPES